MRIFPATRNEWLKLSLPIAIGLFCAAILFICTAPYSVTGTQDYCFSSHQVGELTIIQESENWFYLMIICPGVQVAENQYAGNGINHDIMSDPLFSYEWGTLDGIAHVSFRWNMWTDTISIGKQKFSRKNSNVFVIVGKPNSELTTQSCGKLGPEAGLSEIVQHIKQQLPNDKLVASVIFYDAK